MKTVLLLAARSTCAADIPSASSKSGVHAVYGSGIQPLEDVCRQRGYASPVWVTESLAKQLPGSAGALSKLEAAAHPPVSFVLHLRVNLWSLDRLLASRGARLDTETRHALQRTLSEAQKGSVDRVVMDRKAVGRGGRGNNNFVVYETLAAEGPSSAHHGRESTSFSSKKVWLPLSMATSLFGTNLPHPPDALQWRQKTVGLRNAAEFADRTRVERVPVVVRGRGSLLPLTKDSYGGRFLYGMAVRRDYQFGLEPAIAEMSRRNENAPCAFNMSII